MSDRPDRSQGLGRGLGALIPQRGGAHASAIEIPITRIRANPFQPRKRFDAESLAALAASIAANGVIQPILVSETIDGYQLVAGERRLRAAQVAGLERIPAVVRQLIDRDQLELALVENLQREDLDPLETADAYRQLMNRFGFTADDVANRVGRARSTVANTLRLLDLAPEVQAAVADGRLTRGARPGARRDLARAPGTRARLGRRPGSVGQADRGAGPTPARSRGRRRTMPQRPRSRTPNSSASRRTCAARSAPRSASPDRARAAGS